MNNSNITIEISANTDFVGNNEANKLLSQKRAQSVVDYLIKAGIKADRLTAVGNGEDKPVVVDAVTAQKYPFLKENDVLTEAFIKKLPDNQQEQANQIRITSYNVCYTKLLRNLTAVVQAALGLCCCCCCCCHYYLINTYPTFSSISTL